MNAKAAKPQPVITISDIERRLIVLGHTIDDLHAFATKIMDSIDGPCRDAASTSETTPANWGSRARIQFNIEDLTDRASYVARILGGIETLLVPCDDALDDDDVVDGLDVHAARVALTAAETKRAIIRAGETA